jgi:D-alanine transaminase
MTPHTNVYLNGEFMPLDQARIPVMDRGFLFGDGVYEVIPCYSGRLFRLQHHLQRLNNSLHAIRMENPLDEAGWQQVLERLVAQDPDSDQSVYLQVTRGVAGGRDHAIPKQIPATLFAMACPMQTTEPDPSASGVSAITLDDIRWALCNIKAITLLPNVLLKQQAKDQGAAEAILIRDGLAMEGAASNLFIVRDDTLITPPKGPHLLPGITRDLVLELVCSQGIACREDDISEADLRQADEIWLTSSTKEIMPVTELDRQPVGNGEPGPMFKRVARLYGDYKARIRAGEQL